MLADKDFVAYLVAKKQSPETLLKSIRSLLGKPYITPITVSELDLQQCQQQVNKQFEQVKYYWNKEQDEVINTLKSTTILNQASYKPKSTEMVISALELLLEEQVVPTELFKVPSTAKNFKDSQGFLYFCSSKIEKVVKKGQVLPELNFWSACEDLWQDYLKLKKARELQLQALRLQLLNYLNDTLPAQKQQQQVQSFDDVLLQLEQALTGERGDDLVSILRKQYQAALIDEFQDTDPVQYASFSRIYAQSGLPVFLVGDPKQAIYSFRGADIFTYLDAKKEAKHQYTLEKNWRSHLYLVNAVNAIFSNKDNPFIHEDIPFHPVNSERDDEIKLKLAGDNTAPFEVLWAASDKTLTKGDLNTLAANRTTDEIADLLNLSHVGKATLLDDKEIEHTVTGGDIAVLVRSHKQGNLIQQCLRQRGINSVQQSKDNIFASPQALMLLRLLSAIAEPNNESLIKAALISPIWGLSPDKLLDLQINETQWQYYLDQHHTLHKLWLKHGFMRVFRQLLLDSSAQQQLLSLPDGERQLTNLYHLSELIQTQCSRNNDGIDFVLHWLSQQIQVADNNDETAQLRLESDEQLVKIITIHKSKGLEYPIVFCPFLWDANLRDAKNPVLTFHNAEDGQQYAAFAEPELSQVKEQVTAEEQAEDLRLLYVALTRAKERCVVVWAAVRDVQDAALFSLLHDKLTDKNKPDPATMLADLKTLVDNNSNAISLKPISEQQAIPYQTEGEQPAKLTARKFNGTIQQPWRIASFSALSYHHDAELPDHDALSFVDKSPAITTTDTILDRFSFPRGAQAGTCLHALFEVWDFTSQDQLALQDLVAKTLLNFGFDDKWTDIACQWLHEVVATPLMGDLSLNKLSPEQRLDELAFYFPVTHLSVRELQSALLPLLDDNAILKQTLNNLQFNDLTGFMKGFIDLVFEYQGRYYIVDYKSNHLGDSADDYQTPQLNTAMLAHHYPLQYLIYSLALHRYLQLRLPDYDPQQHLGGSYYLFIRGMKPDWSQSGVFYAAPDIAILDALDRCLQGLQ